MNSKVRPRAFGLLASLSFGAFVVAVFACGSNSTSSECAALAACCASPNFSAVPSSCYETATSGELTDATCEMMLQAYQQQGQCPSDGGAVIEAGTADADGGQ